MQPEIREYYGLSPFTGRTYYRLIEMLGENITVSISGLQDRIFFLY
jgi:hypothetical protein